MKRVVALISALYGDVMDDELVLSTPQVWHGRENTRLHLQGSMASGLYLNRWFTYNRVNLDAIDPFSLTHDQEPDIHTLLSQLSVTPFFTTAIETDGKAQTFQHFLELSDIVNAPIVIQPGQTLALKLHATSGNYVYTGALRVSLTRAP